MIKNRNYFYLFFVFFLFCDSGIATEEFPFLAEIIAEPVNVRSGPNRNFEKVCQLKKSDEIIVLGKEYHWYKIRLPQSASGFIRQDYIQQEGPHTGVILADNVNVRAGAGESFSSLAHLFKGERIEIRGEEENWYKVAPVDTAIAWIAEGYFKFKSSQIPLGPQIRDDRVTPSEENLLTEVPDPPSPVEEKVEEKIDPSFITAIGKLQRIRYPIGEAKFQIRLEDNSIYFLEGNEGVLQELINQKVKVKGTITSDSSSKDTYPVLEVSKIFLVL